MFENVFFINLENFIDPKLIFKLIRKYDKKFPIFDRGQRFLVKSKKIKIQPNFLFKAFHLLIIFKSLHS